LTCRIVFDDPPHGLYGSDIQNGSLFCKLFSGEPPIPELSAALIERLFCGWLGDDDGFGHVGSSPLKWNPPGSPIIIRSGPNNPTSNWCWNANSFSDLPLVTLVTSKQFLLDLVHQRSGDLIGIRAVRNSRLLDPFSALHANSGLYLAYARRNVIATLIILRRISGHGEPEESVWAPALGRYDSLHVSLISAEVYRACRADRSSISAGTSRNAFHLASTRQR